MPEGLRRLVAAIPVLLAGAFLAVAPSDGANIGGGMLLLVAIPISFLLYGLLKLVFPDGGRRRGC